MTACGEVVSSDLSGPYPEAAIGGFRYCVAFLDRYSGWLAVYFARLKSEVPAIFKQYLADVVPLFTVRTLHTDNGGEYTSREMRRLCEDRQIRQSFSNPYEPQGNSQVERR